MKCIACGSAALVEGTVRDAMGEAVFFGDEGSSDTLMIHLTTSQISRS